MKIAVLSDAHGNILYLEKVIDEIKGLQVDKIYYLGDTYGYGRKPNEVINLLNEVNAYCLLGNHDAMLLDYISIDDEKDKIYQIKSQREELTGQQLNYLSSLLPFREDVIGDNRILFVHGSPIDPLQGYLYENSQFNLEKIKFNIVFMGHTHRPYIKQVRDTMYINVGSCGLPRDIGNKPSFAIYDFEKSECQILRVEISQDDVEKCCLNVHESVRLCLYRNTFYN